jgi:uncharacterized protein (TIGR00730 family)
MEANTHTRQRFVANLHVMCDTRITVADLAAHRLLGRISQNLLSGTSVHTCATVQPTSGYLENMSQNPSSAESSAKDEVTARIDDLLAASLRAAGTDRNRDLLRRLLQDSVGYFTDGADRLDLKIASTALAEMRDATALFRPHQTKRTVTIFGSARTTPDDPLYALTRDFAAAMSARDWMVLTGAGPGIMAAGLEGAGVDHALGVTIRLPFESGANEFVLEDNVVEMKYFFTRKLALIKESDAFVVMPGGFGTLDEAFELLTLLQTGKATPVPVVFLGLGKGFWHAWEQFVNTVIDQGYAGDSDRCLYRITNHITEAVREVTNFYDNYRSVRWVGDQLIVRLNNAPSASRLAALNSEFAEWMGPEGMSIVSPLPVEVGERDDVDAARVALRWNRRQPGRLRLLIDALNQQ